MTIKEIAQDNERLMSTITLVGFNGMARIEARSLLENIVKGRRRIYANNSNLTQEDKEWLIKDWENFCKFISRVTISTRWSRIDSAFLASSLIREYDKIKTYDTDSVMLKQTKDEILNLIKNLKKVKGRGHQISMFAKTYQILTTKNQSLIK